MGRTEARGRAFTHAESGAVSLPRIDSSGSEIEWRGVGDKPAKKEEARLLTKGEQLLYSGCMKALPLAYAGPPHPPLADNLLFFPLDLWYKKADL